MPGNTENGYTVLIVSAVERFAAIVERSFKGYIKADRVKSVSAARRRVLERDYDLVVINAPLPDESGERFALDAARETNASVLLVVPSEVFEDMLELATDCGVLVISKPIPRGKLDKSIRLLTAFQNKIRELRKELQKAREKMEETRIVNKAKFVLVEQKNMTEDEAHRYIGKQAMNNGVSRKRVAEAILDEYE